MLLLICFYNALYIVLPRFVNHVTEKGQAKVHAQPVHLLAEKVKVFFFHLR